MYPQELYYTQQHEWIRVDGDTGTIGITEYAQKELGDIVYVELPKAGEQLTLGESFGTVESVKAVSEIYAPVSGQVVAVNETVQSAPEKLNSDPHGEAWLLRLRLRDHGEIDQLLSADQYEEYLKEEEGSH
jgi:glycine cleavage system H protein